MLDVHPPHEPIYSWRDFLIHLFTITIGLLIALGLEGCTEYLHHRHVRHQAEENLRIEIEGNRKQLADQIEEIKKQQAQLKANVATLRILAGRPKKTSGYSINVHFSGITLDDTAFRTAQLTGAFAYMPYEEAEKIATVYAAQNTYTTFQQQSYDTTAAAVAVVVDTQDPGKWKAQDFDSAVDRMTRMEAQLLVVSSAAQEALNEDTKYLAEHGKS